MRRLIATGAVALCAAAAAIVTSLAFRGLPGGAEVALLDAVRAATGLEVAANGRAQIELLPTPRIFISAVSLSQQGEQPFAVVRQAVGAPEIGPLLAGRIVLGEVTLDGAQVAIDRAPLGSLFGRGGVMRDAPEIRLTDARLSFGAAVIDKVEAGLSWAGGGRPFSVSGYGIYEGRPVEVAVTLSDAKALAGGEAAPMRARIEGGGARLTFDGTARVDGGPHFSGDLRARAASLRETLQWLGLPAPRRTSPLTGFSLAGRASADRKGVAITDAELNLEGGSFLGAGRIALVHGRPNVEATLDASLIDLAPYVEGIAPAVNETDGWSPKRLDLRPLAGYDLDLRLSADEVRFGAWRLGATAATLAISDGAIDLSVGEADAYGGVVGGRFSLAPERGSTRMRLQAASTDVDLGRALADIVAQPWLTGTLTSDFAIEGVGASAAEIVSTLSGRGSARVVGGALKGIGRSKTLALAGLRGSMDVDHASAKLIFSRGVADIDDFAIAGEDAAFTLSGDARLVERDIALRGFVRPVDGTWTLPVKVVGPLDAPKLRPNLTGRDPRGEAQRTDVPKSGG
jgi:AsmA protein